MENLVKRKNSRMGVKENLYGWLFILAPMVLLVVFLFIPLVASAIISFTRWNLTTLPQFLGLANFVELFNDEVFIKSIGNTFILMIGIPIGMVFSFLLAVALKRKMVGRTFFRVVLYLPAVTSGIAVAVVWKFILNQAGLLNQFLELFGLTNLPNWLGDPGTIKPAFIIMGIWGGLGSTMLLFLAGLNNIDGSLYEAAEIDGAGKFTQMMKISLPLMSPVIFYVMILGIIGGLQSFGQTYIMAPGGGIDNSATTMVYFIWRAGFDEQRMGFASSAAWILAIFIFVITGIQFLVQKYWVEGAEN